MEFVPFVVDGYHVTPLSAGAAATGLAAAGLGLYVLLVEHRNRLSLSFFVITLLMSVWLLSFGAVYAAPDEATAVRWGRAAYLAIPALPVAIYTFIIQVVNRDVRRRRLVGLLWLGAAVTSLVVAGTEAALTGAIRQPWGYTVRFHPLAFPVPAFMCGVLVLSLWELAREYRTAVAGPHRRRVRWLFAAFGVGAFAVLDYLEKFGLPVLPLGFIPALGALAILAWIIRTFRLTDLATTFRESQVLETMGDPVLVCDERYRVRLVNAAARSRLGRPHELEGRPVASLLGAGEEAWREARSSLHEGTLRDWETTIRPAEGEPIEVSVSGSLLRDPDGRTYGCLFTARTIAARKTAERALQEAEDKYSRVFRVSPVAIAIASLTDHRYVEVNPAFERFFGYRRDEVVGRAAPELGLWADPAERSRVLQTVRAAGDVRNAEVRLRTRDGEVKDVLFFAERFSIGDNPYVVGMTYDISDRKAAERTLERLALYDVLTGLPNRSLFHNRLDHAVARAQRTEGRVAVLFIDLDEFKRVNDALGHAMGDRLLSSAADRFQRALREGDTLARIGGDEFAALLEDIDREEDAVATAERLARVLDEPFHLADTAIEVTASIGIALGGAGLEEPGDLLRFADVAMYRAKRAGGGGHRVFDPAADSAVTRRLYHENALRRAIDGGELELRYQPILDLGTGRAVAAEALVRWRHPERGILLPADFIPLAEETGLIIDLGHWVIGSAVAGVAALAGTTGRPPDFLCVNLSAREFFQRGLVERVGEVLERWDWPPGALVLEITERVAMQAGARLHELRDLGVRIAIDDFGTGYASLAYLKTLPADVLKIDRAFVMEVASDPVDRAIVRTIIGLARELGMEVVAEGIERPEQLDALADLGCTLVQGRLLAPPMPAETLEGWEPRVPGPLGPGAGVSGDGGVGAAADAARESPGADGTREEP